MKLQRQVTCAGCGKTETIEIPESGKVPECWAYYGKFRFGIGNWAKYTWKGLDEKGAVILEKCHPWWRELKYHLIDLKRLLLRQYRDVEMWFCKECDGKDREEECANA